MGFEIRLAQEDRARVDRLIKLLEDLIDREVSIKLKKASPGQS